MLLPPNVQINDYKIVPANQVANYLRRGFIPYGTPINSASSFYQAMIKMKLTSDSGKQKTNDVKPYLNKIEQQCVVLLSEGKTPDEIAKQVYRSTRRVRTILIELRNRLGYKSNAQLVLELERFGLL